MKLHYEGYFTEPPTRQYRRGIEFYVDTLDRDALDMEHLHKIIKELGYNQPNYYKLYFKKPDGDLYTGLQELCTDEDVMTVRHYIGGHTLIEVYCERWSLTLGDASHQSMYDPIWDYVKTKHRVSRTLTFK